MPVLHNLTATTPDDPQYEIRPSHWNAGHSVSIVGSEVSGAFSNAGNVTFGLETNGFITASANAAGAGDGFNRISAGTQLAGTNNTIVFSNSNGISFGLSNSSVMTASYTVPTVPTAYVSSVNGSSGAISLNVGSSLSSSTNGSSITFGLASNITTALQSAGAYLTTAALSNHSHGNPQLNLTNLSGTTASNSAGFTLSLSAAAPGGAASQTLFATGNTTVNSSGTMALSSVLMRGYGIVSLGTSNGSILVSTPDATDFSPLSVGFSTNGNTSGNTGLVTGQLVLAGGNNVTLSGSTNGGSMTVTISGGAGGAGYSAGVSNVGNTAGATGLTGTNMVFVGTGPVSLSQTTGANGGTISINAPATSSLSATGAVSLSTNGSTISIGVGTVTAFATSNTTQNSSGTINLNSLLIQGAGIASVGYSNGSVVISVPSGGGAGDGVNILAAGTQTAATTGTVAFSNSNGITFGMSNSSIITASHNGITSQSNQTGGVYAVGNTTGQSSSSTYDLRTLSVDGAGIVSAGWSAGSLRISATQSNQAFSAGAASSTFQTLSFQDSNGVSFSNNAGAIRVTHALAGTATAITGGALITLNSGGLSFNGSSLAGVGTTFNGTNVSGSMTLNTAGLRLDLSAAAGGGGGVTPVVSAANGSYSFTTLSLSNANGISFGTSAGSAVTASYTVPTVTQYFSATNTTFNGANISGSMTLNTNGLQLSMSVAAPGAAAENNAIALLGANTSGNTTATGSTIGWSGQGVTLSGTNGSQVVISAPATSSLVGVGGISLSTNGSTISVSYTGAPDTRNFWNPQDGYVQVAGQVGQASMHVQPAYAPNVTFDRICLPVNVTNSSNSTGTVTISFGFGIYTRNASTLSLMSSTSGSQAITFSGTVNNSTFAGMRLMTIPWSSSLAEGQYYIGLWSRTTTGGGNCTVSNFVASQVNSTFSGILGAASDASVQYTRGLGFYSASFSTAIPAAIQFSELRGNSSAALRQPIFNLLNLTF